MAANAAAKHFNYGKRREDLLKMSRLTNSPLIHPHVNVNGTRVTAEVRLLTHLIQKEAAVKSLAAIPGSLACINIDEVRWDLMAELEGLGYGLAKYIRIVQTEKCYTGGYRLVMYIDMRKLLDHNGSGIPQLVRPVTCDPPPRRSSVQYDALSEAGKTAWQRAEAELDKRMKKTPIGNDEVLAVLSDIRLSKDQTKYLQDGIGLNLMSAGTIADVTTKFEAHYRAVKDYKASMSQEPVVVAAAPPPPTGGGLLLCCISLSGCCISTLF